jgi:hypothetical protein
MVKSPVKVNGRMVVGRMRCYLSEPEYRERKDREEKGEDHI